VSTHLWQNGLFSSHLTFLILLLSEHNYCRADLPSKFLVLGCRPVMGLGTDLQVAQPVFTLVLHWMFRLRATRFLAIVKRGVGHSSLSRNTLQTRRRIVASKKSGQTNQMMQLDSSPGDHEEGESGVAFTMDYTPYKDQIPCFSWNT